MKQSKDHPNGKTPVIALTANAVVGAKEKYLEEGFTNYLAKPIHEDELMEMLREYLPKELVKMKENTKKTADTTKEKALELATKNADYPYIQEHHEEVMTEYGELLVELQNGRGGKTNE